MFTIQHSPLLTPSSSTPNLTTVHRDMRTNKLIQHYPAHMEGITEIAFHPSGNYLASTSRDNSIKVLARHAAASALLLPRHPPLQFQHLPLQLPPQTALPVLQSMTLAATLVPVLSVL